MTTKSDFKNFAVFTVDISSVEQKTSKEGQPYVLAFGTLPMNKGDPMPMRIVALEQHRHLDHRRSVHPGWAPGLRRKRRARHARVLPDQGRTCPQRW